MQHIQTGRTVPKTKPTPKLCNKKEYVSAKQQQTCQNKKKTIKNA